MTEKVRSPEICEYTDNLDLYLRFTRSPRRKWYLRHRDFRRLWKMPEVQAIKFIDPEIMVIGTCNIVVSNFEKPFKEHDIGEFLIFIVRKRNNRMWEPQFWFHNATRVVQEVYHHPHIYANDTDKDMIGGVPVGKLCIGDGRHGVYQDIRSGNIHSAVERLILILRTYQSGAYETITNWPER